MKTLNLTASPFNPRKITDKRLEMLKKSMAEFGDLSGIVFNVKTGRLVGGHQRTRLFDPSWPIVKSPCQDNLGTVAVGHIETPWGRWAYREVSWTPTREALANIAANQHGGEFDMPKLKEIIVEIDDGSIDLELTGFNRHELELNMTAIHQDEEKHSPLRANFAGNYGADKDTSDDPAPTGDKFPVTLILSREEHEKWQAVKNRLKIQGDKTAFLQLIGGQDA